jgi:iron complex transport system substrate-binding protein
VGPVRIVSLLPSATEILFAVGAGDEVVGVTFECDHPPEARGRRIVSTTALPEGLTPGEIDVFVTAAVARGEDLYRLDAGALAELDPDLVVTQDLCAVCAVDVGTVQDALGHLGCRAEVLTVDPHTLAEVLASVETIAEAVGRRERGVELVAGARTRLDAVRRDTAGRPRPRVLVLEWTDPPYSAGHWLPDLVTAAGGVPALGRAGDRSAPVTWQEVRATRADVVVVAPCGYDLPASSSLAAGLVERELLPPGVPVWAADANASWTRPTLRLVDAIDSLASVLHGCVSQRSGDLAGMRLIRPSRSEPSPAAPL